MKKKNKEYEIYLHYVRLEHICYQFLRFWVVLGLGIAF